MKKLLSIFLLYISLSAFAPSAMALTGLTVAGVPTKVSVDRSDGFMVYGDSFANPGGCSVPNRFYVKSTHPQYQQLFATVLAAATGKLKIQAFITSCSDVAWYGTGFNTVDSTGTVQILN